MFNKNLKKKVAVLLTGVMVLGMTVTAFAKTGTAVESEGVGNFEGHVNRKVVDVTLPTVSAGTTPFGFIYDAEGLLKETTAAYGAGYTFTGRNVYFKTADKTFGKQSQKFTVSNNSSVSVNITLNVAVTSGEKDPELVAETSLPSDYDRTSSSSVSGDPSLYLGLVVTGDETAAGDPEGTYVVSGNGIEKTFNIDGKPQNYIVSINQVGETSYPHEYEFKIKDGALAAWDKIEFQMEGAANIVENAKGMTAPDLKVTWNYEGDDGDEGGDTPSIVDVAGHIEYDGPTDALWLGKSASEGLTTEAITIADVKSVTLQYNDTAAIDVKSIAHVEEVDGSYWVWASVTEAEALGITNAEGTYKMVVTIDNTRYTGTITF